MIKMKIEPLKPSFDADIHKYATAVIASGIPFPIEGYLTEEALEKGHTFWHNYSIARGISKPVPIRFIDGEGRVVRAKESKLKCEICPDLFKKVRGNTVD